MNGVAVPLAAARSRRAGPLAAAAVVAGLASVALEAAGPAGRSPLRLAVGLAVGWAFVGAGLVAWQRRGEERFGVLMVAMGFAWFASSLVQARDAAVFTLGLAVFPLFYATFTHALLAFPTGRLPTRLARLIVIAVYVDVTVVEWVWMLFAEPDRALTCGCAENLALVSDQPRLADAIAVAQQPVTAVLLGSLAIVELARRRRAASPPERRALTPVFAAGSASVVLLVGGLVLADSATDTGGPVTLLGLVALASVPFAFLVGLVRSRLSRLAVGDLVVELGDARAPGRRREALRRALGDPSLDVAYWVPDKRAFVDGGGRRVELPADHDRVVTMVHHHGERVAALVHDPALARQPGLLSAACAAAGLALANDRLAAELRGRVEELRASRARLVEAGDAERRRLERNLHDGAQQRLLSLAMMLRLARSRAETDPAATVDILEGAADELRHALEELRELARGIHPAVLADHGLPTALEALAARCALPLELAVDVPARPPEPVEAAAYYVISEAVANAVKYAGADAVRVEARREAGCLRVVVADSGAGGADPAAGTGLRGLVDRVEALGGRLAVESPPGGGTRVEATLPLP